MELYRRLRPTSFEEMVGSRSTLSVLSKMVETKRIPHFLLFTGPSGTGKTTAARILAKELGCEGLDFREMNSANFNGIATIRDVQEKMRLSPMTSKCRVFLMDEVHQFSKDAQDAANKMLEDTPSHVYFFWCTSEPNKLIKAVLTRGSPMVFNSISDSDIEDLLDRTAKSENIKLASDARAMIVEAAGGSARMAMVLLEKISHLSVKEQAEAVEAVKVEQAETKELCQALMTGKSWPTVAGILKNLKTEPETVRRAVLGYARNTLLNDGSKKRAHQMLISFEKNFYDSGTAGLTLSCYEVVNS